MRSLEHLVDSRIPNKIWPAEIFFVEEKLRSRWLDEIVFKKGVMNGTRISVEGSRTKPLLRASWLVSQPNKTNTLAFKQ